MSRISLFHLGDWDTHCIHCILSEVICDVLKEEWIDGWLWRQKDSNISGLSVDTQYVKDKHTFLVRVYTA